MDLEPIKRLRLADPELEAVQAQAILSAETSAGQHLTDYLSLPGAFGGRYIAADLFKETFPAYAESRESRARFNVAVHNASAVLSAALYRKVLTTDGPNRAILLTGIPGAGKTTSVLVQGAIPPDTRLIFEGQMWRPESTLPKLQQALDAGVQPVIVVVHPQPEYALRNTFKRFREIGRGSSIDTMANIQGGLPDGLEAVRERFGEAVQLIVYDIRNPARRSQLVGWDNLSVLRSEGTREQIHQRLVAELERARDEGLAPRDVVRQALGEAIEQASDHRGVGREPAAEDGGAEPQRDAQARVRAQAFLTLPEGEGVGRFPELASAYEAMRNAEHFALAQGTQPDMATYLGLVRAQIAEQLDGGKVVLSRALPERTKAPPDLGR